MNKLWITYAWKDNEQEDVDFVARKIRDLGVEVLLDRTQLLAGTRLWDQISKQIDDSSLDGWAIFASENSLASEPCQEELAYALDRALRTKGSNFPLIGIFPAPMERKMIPSAIATRLYVSLKDADWATRVADAVNGRSSIKPPEPDDDYFNIHQLPNEWVYEMRPRDGFWYPAKIAVREAEYDNVRFKPYLGPRNTPSFIPPMFQFAEGDIQGPDGHNWKTYYVQEQLDNTRSLYLRSSQSLSAIAFGGNRLKIRVLSV